MKRQQIMWYNVLSDKNSPISLVWLKYAVWDGGTNVRIVHWRLTVGFESKSYNTDKYSITRRFINETKLYKRTTS